GHPPDAEGRTPGAPVRRQIGRAAHVAASDTRAPEAIEQLHLLGGMLLLGDPFASTGRNLASRSPQAAGAAGSRRPPGAGATVPLCVLGSPGSGAEALGPDRGAYSARLASRVVGVGLARRRSMRAISSRNRSRSAPASWWFGG